MVAQPILTFENQHHPPESLPNAGMRNTEEGSKIIDLVAP